MPENSEGVRSVGSQGQEPQNTELGQRSLESLPEKTPGPLWVGFRMFLRDQACCFFFFWEKTS